MLDLYIKRIAHGKDNTFYDVMLGDALLHRATTKREAVDEQLVYARISGTKSGSVINFIAEVRR